MYIYALNNNLDLPIGSFSENSFNLADDENEIDFELDKAKPVDLVTNSNWQDIAIKYIDQLKFKSPKNLQ